jgi:thiamine pyrophosphate-dependent acetolactate synthase large subunit-like protein
LAGVCLAAEIESPPYDKVAELCGALGFAVTKPEQIGAAISEALSAKRPAVIHVKIDPNALNTLRKDMFAKEDE